MLPYNLNIIRLILLSSLQKRFLLSSGVSMCDHTAVALAEYAREYGHIFETFIFINDASSIYYIMFISDYTYIGFI